MASNRMAKLRARRTDPTVVKAAAIREVFDSISEAEPIKYAVSAMQPVSPVYTENTFEEGDRVKAQLQKALNQTIPTAEFEYQGSVTNNTHVKVHSDIDLLVIHTDFYSIEPPGQPSSPYEGDPLAELKKLRTQSAQVLKTAFPTATVDDSPGRSIALKGGSLRRKIDVVISNWWDTVEYQQQHLAYQRGVRIYDSKQHTRIKNSPFLHNALVDQRDRALQGNVRKVARLLKELKYDADTEVTISSYDITAIAY